MPTTAPYGTWKSPITPASLCEATVGLSDVQVFGGRVWWNELRPAEGGRYVLVSAPLDGGEATDVLPEEFSVRTQVHEYGGRCYTGNDDLLVFSNWDDQRLWASRDGGKPKPITAEPPEPRAVRFADPVVSPDGRFVACVRESHGSTVDNDLVAITLDQGRETPPPVVLASGHDFYSAPRFSPDGERIAWVAWDHPFMPWDSTFLYEATFHEGVLGNERLVAGGAGESVSQPRFSPGGALHYVSDRSGWWNIYSDANGEERSVAAMDAEFSGPDWVFGQATYAFLADGTLVATWGTDAGSRIGPVGPEGPRPLDLPYTKFSSVITAGDGIAAIAGSPTEFPAVIRVDMDGSVTVLRRARRLAFDLQYCSIAQKVTFPSAGEEAYAWFYRPTNPEYTALGGELPPVVVMIHGGPTASTSSVLRPDIQYWTTRGFAVVDVDYRGSTGYGRGFRDRLKGSWGVCDVEDCASVVTWLDDQGLVDGQRAVIRGGSAGGFTTLAALAFTDVFAAGASLFGVPDLELLARDTHKFESRYLDQMVGPWPEAADVYRERSPIHHLEGFHSPLVVFQGDEDRVVPKAQADLIFAALRDRGVPVAYILFEGEQHGFRKAATIEAVAAGELAFYGRVLGFVPDGDPPLPRIENSGSLPPVAER